MRHFLLIFPLLLGAPAAAHAGALEEQAKHDPALAEAIRSAKADGTFRQPNLVPQKDLDRASAYIMQRDEFNLRRLGMTPSTAHKGIWAAAHKPDSACAGYIRQLTAEADAPPDAPAQHPETIQMLIMSIERSGTCERRNLD